MEYDDELKDMYFVVVRMLVLFVSLMDDKTTSKDQDERQKKSARERERNSLEENLSFCRWKEMSNFNLSGFLGWKKKKQVRRL